MAQAFAESHAESPYAWLRLVTAILIGTIGGVGMWSPVVVVPAVQADFGVARAEAALPYTLTMIGFVFGSIIAGRMADKRGIILPVVLATITMSAGYMLASQAPSFWVFAAICGVMGFMGSAAFFAPLLADTSMWFDRRRGLAISLCAAGNYVAGTIWPPVLEHFISTDGWRATHFYVGVFCLITLLPLSLVLRRRPPVQPAPTAAAQSGMVRPLGLHPNMLQGLILLMGLGCCVAMSMPQVHIVAYCVDLGYGPARGAEMLSLMLGFGIVSRLASGYILDRIGGLKTLLLGSTLQMLALALYLPFDGLMSLYVISAVFGLVQGGIVPSYAFIIRELFPAAQAGLRVSLAISATLAGMALGGWMSGKIYDFTGSYQAALLNGIAFNLVNILIAAWLLYRLTGGRRIAAVAA
ncbi:MAG: MFS transporter [Ferrovibrio sp.]